MKINDSNYLEMLRKRNNLALDFVVHKYLPLIKGITYKTLSSVGGQEMIEECINDIFFSIWRNIDKFQGEEADFKKWICAIAKFKSIDYYRKHINSKEVVCDEIVEQYRVSAEDEFIINHDRNELIKLLDKLGEYDKKIFIMKFFLMFKNEDIALRLGVTKASIDNRIYRGKKILKSAREKY